MYPSIGHQQGLTALREALDNRSKINIPTENLIEMANFVLSNNFFEFDNQIKQQISGTAIGTKFAPPFACIFMDQMESRFLETQGLKPFIWFRYIDDIFFIWNHGEEQLKLFMENLNQFENNIRFTYDSNKENIIFLDLNIKLDRGTLVTTINIKPTDCHQYLHFDSSHPEHTKRSIVYSQTLRVSRLCSLKPDFNEHCADMKSWFLERGYPENIIETEMKKVNFDKGSLKKGKEAIGVPLVVTLHPILKNLAKVLRENLLILHMNTEVKQLFLDCPMVSFRSARKISSYLVRAKLYPLIRDVGSTKCGKTKCDVCMNVNETDTFRSNVTKESYKINHKLNCDDKCLVYLLSCKKCDLQYVGQTTNKFRMRWNNYKSESKKLEKGQNCMQQHFHEHFNSTGHTGFLNDVSITLIDKTDGSNPTKREYFWIRTLRTMSPLGFNIENNH